MEKEEEVDRRRGGKTISKSGQGWTLPAQPRLLKRGQDGKGLLRSHLWCPNDHARLWDRLETPHFEKMILVSRHFKKMILLS